MLHMLQAENERKRTTKQGGRHRERKESERIVGGWQGRGKKVICALYQAFSKKVCVAADGLIAQ